MRWRSRRKSTSIETKVASLLKENDIYYRREYRVENYPVDFYIPSCNLIIQVDGCYYHGLACCINQSTLSNWQTARKFKDRARNGVIKSKGFRYLRLTGCDINERWEESKEKILGYINYE